MNGNDPINMFLNDLDRLNLAAGKGYQFMKEVLPYRDLKNRVEHLHGDTQVLVKTIQDLVTKQAVKPVGDIRSAFHNGYHRRN